MLINLRNALMSGKRLPYDAEVEFLESTGTQWIDTGVVPTSQTKWMLDAMFSAEDTSAYMAMGAIWTNPTRRFIIGREQLNRISISYGTFDNILKIAAHGIRQTYVLDAPNFTWQAGSKSGTFSYGTFDITGIGNIFLFARNRFGAVNAATKGFRVYQSSIYDSERLVRDFIPVRVGTTGYLYDRVSGALFGNAGTGDFVLGSDVVPVEYIESHGTEYIDTGVVATNSHGFRVDIATSQKSGNVNTRIFGVHEGNVRCGFALYGTVEPSGNDFFWGWNAATGFIADIPQRFVASLNYKNDRAAIFDGTTNLSSLGTLGNTTKSIYLLNANYNGAPFENQYVVGKLYGAEITVGSDVANHYLPVRVGTEGAMMDVLTRRIYRNAGTGAFGYGNDLKYPIPAE